MKFKFILLCFVLFGTNFSLYSQPEGYTSILDLTEIRTKLSNAELARDLPLQQSNSIISLPFPDGSIEQFKVAESPVLGQVLSARFPEIKSYLIEGVNDKSFHGRIATGPNKITAVFYTPQGITYLEPIETGSAMYVSYHTDSIGKRFECGADAIRSADENNGALLNSMNTLSNGANLRTYDMIIATTGEFYQANGNNNTAVTEEVNMVMSGMNVFYENEVSIHFDVVSINLLSNPATDGLDPNGNRTGDAQSVINTYANNNGISYDIGHVMHTTASGGSGVAGTGPCTTNGKARAWSGLQAGSSVYSWVSLMGHEIGHQFGAAHSYYGTEFNCQNRSAGNGYEPGSGSTVMSYEGICQSQNITPAPSTNYFHVHSLTQIINYANGTGSCSSNTATGNSIPSVTMPNTIMIPRETPFYLNGSATDADGDPLTYCWEQYDTDSNVYPQDDPAGIPANAATAPTRPLFRSFDPTSDSDRYFPQLSDVVTGNSTQGEVLSSVARTITMRLTARDNVVGGGAFEYQEMSLTVDGNSGPFSVSNPNGGETFTAGNAMSVTWNTASTTSYCSTVDVLLSVDGGYNYPYTLMSGTNNDGSVSVVIPAGVTNTSIARVMVRCANNPDAYFFDISNDDFNINSDCLAPNNVFTNTSPTTYAVGQTIDLNVTPSFLGTTISGFTGTNFSFGSIGVKDAAGTGCDVKNGNMETITFTVDATGSYGFSQNPAFCGFSLFDGSSTSCANFLGSTLTANANGSTGVNSASISANLVAGNTYTLAVTNFFNSTTVAFSGIGSVLTTGSLPNNYSYSYLVVNRATGQVVDVDAGANFTGIGAGTYDVYGFAYENDGSNSTAPPDVNPATFIGQSIAAILSGGDCVSFSNNFESLTVTGSSNCPTSYTLSGNEFGVGGQNNDGDFETDGIISSTQEILGGPVDYDSGTYIDLNPGFRTLLGVDFHAFIDGCGGVMMPTGNDTSIIAPENENNLEVIEEKNNE